MCGFSNFSVNPYLFKRPIEFQATTRISSFCVLLLIDALLLIDVYF